MKSRCEFCEKDISYEVQHRLASYQVGKISCASCHKQNKRYISTLDLEVYTLGLMVIYTLAALVPLSTSLIKMNMWVLIGIMVVIITLIFWGTLNWARYVYNKAPLKKKWANYTIKEDAAAVAKLHNRFFISFIIMLFGLGMISVATSVVWYFIIGIVGFMAFFIFYTYRTYQIEKTYYEVTFAKQEKNIKEK